MNTDCMCGIGIGEEPYRQLGVAVNEAEMLDATVVSRVARAKNVYSREYRAVSQKLQPHNLWQHCTLMWYSWCTSISVAMERTSYC